METQINLLDLRAEYLRKAAYSLTISSPTVAASLGETRTRLINEVELDLAPKDGAALRREFCGACGSPTVPGWSCRTVIRSQNPNVKNERQDQADTKPQKSIVTTCVRCNRETTHTIQQKASRPIKKTKTSKVPLSLNPKVDRGHEHGVAKTANASSKQRQKTRKAGLQAMLERNKAQSSKPPTLHLMDFFS